MIYPLEIVGRDGVKLDDVWGEAPAAYLGITVPQFPNLFLMYGPETNAVNGTSLFFQSECWMRYILGCIDQLVADGARAMEPRQDVHDDYDRRTKEELTQHGVGAPLDSSTRTTRTRRASCTPCSRGASSTTGAGPTTPDPDDYVFT